MPNFVFKPWPGGPTDHGNHRVMASFPGPREVKNLQTPRRQRVCPPRRGRARQTRGRRGLPRVASLGLPDAQSPSAQLRHSELQIVNGTRLQILLCRPCDITVTIRPISPTWLVQDLRCISTSPAMTTQGQLRPQNPPLQINRSLRWHFSIASQAAQMTEIMDDDGAVVGRGGRLGRQGLAAPAATDGSSARQMLLGRPGRVRIGTGTGDSSPASSTHLPWIYNTIHAGSVPRAIFRLFWLLIPSFRNTAMVSRTKPAILLTLNTCSRSEPVCASPELYRWPWAYPYPSLSMFASAPPHHSTPLNFGHTFTRNPLMSSPIFHVSQVSQGEARQSQRYSAASAQPHHNPNWDDTR
ncbi:hypothetical protein B0H14DRAFT_2618810 [Mycena olivaceomarginata]|nr:hypothetical protein B0H14DRAFT_2618810 [Mycena olivaceomarginata]